jgi:hypothetical protein
MRMVFGLLHTKEEHMLRKRMMPRKKKHIIGSDD